MNCVWRISRMRDLKGRNTSITNNGLHELSPGSWLYWLYSNCFLYVVCNIFNVGRLSGSVVWSLQSWEGAGLFVASFSFSVFLLEPCGWNSLTPSYMVPERWKLSWLESECGFNICWENGACHSTRKHTSLAGSSIARAADELTTPSHLFWKCDFYI